MKKFYCRENKDAARVFIQTLAGAGYQQVNSPDAADFLLMDHDYERESYARWRPYFTPAARRKRPVFIYPHVPYSYFLWDAIVKPTGAACNFVVAEGGKEAMRLYGYPYRVEVVGFAGMDVQPFTPTNGTKLLFAPAHPIHNRQYPKPEGLAHARRAAEWIVQNLDAFERVTVRYSHTLEESGLEAFKGMTGRVQFEPVDIYRTPDIRRDALRAIADADIIVSQSTFGYLSIAAGKPTVFYGYKDMTPHSREGYVKQYEKYRHIFYYPLVLEDMSVDELLAARLTPDEHVENWKRLNVGENFNAAKFLNVIREYV